MDATIDIDKVLMTFSRTLDMRAQKLRAEASRVKARTASVTRGLQPEPYRRGEPGDVVPDRTETLGRDMRRRDELEARQLTDRVKFLEKQSAAAREGRFLCDPRDPETVFEFSDLQALAQRAGRVEYADQSTLAV